MEQLQQALAAMFAAGETVTTTTDADASAAATLAIATSAKDATAKDLATAAATLESRKAELIALVQSFTPGTPPPVSFRSVAPHGPHGPAAAVDWATLIGIILELIAKFKK